MQPIILSRVNKIHQRNFFYSNFSSLTENKSKAKKESTP